MPEMDGGGWRVVWTVCVGLGKKLKKKKGERDGMGWDDVILM